MHWIRYLVTFILSTSFLIKFVKGKTCMGLHCDLKELFQANMSSLINQLINEANNATSVKNPLHKNVQPFARITNSRKLNKKCCQNGGTCFLGSLCMCPKHFTGRYCEVNKETMDCGHVSHGDWVRKKCQLCRCFSGTLKCFTPEYEIECGQRHTHDAHTRSGGWRPQENKMFIIPKLFTVIMVLLYTLLTALTM